VKAHTLFNSHIFACEHGQLVIFPSFVCSHREALEDTWNGFNNPETLKRIPTKGCACYNVRTLSELLKKKQRWK